MPSMAPSHAGPAPMAARNAGSTAVAVSWLQSLKRLVRPTPRTVRLSQECFSVVPGMGRQFTVERSKLKVWNSPDVDFAGNSKARSEKRQRGCRTLNLFLGGAVEDDSDLFESD